MRVLLIEDDADMIDMLRLVLGEIAGWEVLSFRSGEELLNQLDELADPDLALIDLNMEPLRGPDVVRQLKERDHNEFPVLYLTGQPPGPADLELVDGWIQKPFTYDELMAQLRQKLGHRLPF
ncbi:MAG: response regulator [bacterium]